MTFPPTYFKDPMGIHKTPVKFLCFKMFSSFRLFNKHVKTISDWISIFTFDLKTWSKINDCRCKEVCANVKVVVVIMSHIFHCPSHHKVHLCENGGQHPSLHHPTHSLHFHPPHPPHSPLAYQIQNQQSRGLIKILNSLHPKTHSIVLSSCILLNMLLPTSTYCRCALVFITPVSFNIFIVVRLYLSMLVGVINWIDSCWIHPRGCLASL